MKLKIHKNGLRIFLGVAGVLYLVGSAQSGSLEPSGPPGPTTQIPPAWSQIIPGPERFELVMGGVAVLDKETGLVWERSPSTFERPWADSVTSCYVRERGGRFGWRLPTVEELASLIDRRFDSPSLPSGHPFSLPGNGGIFWSASTSFGFQSETSDIDVALIVQFGSGSIDVLPKSSSYNSWCVRGGHGHDAFYLISPPSP